MSEEMRFGLMIDSAVVERWQAETVRMLIDNGIFLDTVIVNASEDEKMPFLRKLRDYPWRRLFFRLWNRFVFKPESKVGTDVSDLLKNAQVLECQPINKGISTYLSDDDVAKIKNRNLDFILRFGFGILRGEALKSSKYGVWSFHHDDERVVRGGPPGFWEFLRKIPSNGIILQQLTDSLDKGLIIKRIRLNTILHSYKAHLDNLYFNGEVLPLQACRDIQNGCFTSVQSDSAAPIVHPPVNLTMLHYVWLSVWRRFKFHINRVLRQEDWNVGFVMSSSNALDFDIKSKDIHWFVKNKKTDYFADPFVIKTEKDTYIFFEWFSYSDAKGCLAVALKSENFTVFHKIGNFTEHRSYPFVFQWKNTVYCVPEANVTNKVTLYRFNEDDLSLDEDCVLLDGGRFVDSTLFNHNGKWFLFTSQQEKSHTHLDVFVSDNLRGPYFPHKNNPVVTDCRSARMAGKIIEFDGNIYRVGQNSESHYGQSITLNKILELSENKYFEIKEKDIDIPRDCTYNRGIHTINDDGGIIVFDAKRFVFTFAGMKFEIFNT